MVVPNYLHVTSLAMMLKRMM